MKILHTKSDDGTKIRLGRWNDDGDKDVLLVHGLAEHLGRYSHVAEFFAERGWRVTALEFRGHGESEGQRGHTTSWMKYCEDLQAAMSAVGRPMVMVSFDGRTCHTVVNAALSSSKGEGLRIKQSLVGLV